MDGNRRWARARSLPGIMGHQKGADSVRRIVESSARLGIEYLTLYAFSSENWKRPPGEIGGLMDLLRFYLKREVKSLKSNNIRIGFLGERSALSKDIRELMSDAEERTKDCTGLVVTIALNYGSRQDIVSAATQLALKAKSGELDPATIDESLFSRSLNSSGLPDPDLLIRTSGEQRLSNFLLWEMAYCEFVFLDIHWPDFDESHLVIALEEYKMRDRRYGASVAC